MEHASLELLDPVPEERLLGWLAEFYGKPVEITRRELLRHRDLSYVERLWIAEGLPESLIYKLVLPPWDIEQDLHERVLIPSVSNSARLFLSAHYGQLTALFIEDLGTGSLLTTQVDSEMAARIGKDLAKLHRSYSYRTDELMQLNVLRSLLPLDYEQFAGSLGRQLVDWKLVSSGEEDALRRLGGELASKLAGEPISIVHGDLFAENILLRGERLFIIDWSWFTIIGVPTMDLATLTMDHYKNGSFTAWRDIVIESYSFESGREVSDCLQALPYAATLSRLLFLHWLIERRNRGILGTTIGPVDGVIQDLVKELKTRTSGDL